ncbi:MAG: hypothetical protein A2X02_03340 [Bacteroidetes bacterium GWF2_29_10]|nr:MAG: hypothetical protein A2X02_03340 [Bacteroidetes bacterium GWF2_29_10]
MKKFLFVTQGYELYGSDRTFIQSVKSIKENNADSFIKVIIPKNGDLFDALKEYADELIVSNISVIRKNDLRRFNLKNIFLLPFNIIKYFKLAKEFDYIYINTIVVLDFIIISKFIKNKCFIHVHEIPIGFIGAFFNKLVRFSGSNIIFNSNATKNAYKLNKTQNYYVIHNGVDGYKNVKSKKFASEEIRILMIGRLSYQKGQLLLIEVINKLVNDLHKRLKIKIVGDVFENNIEIKIQIQNKIKLYNLENFIELLPFSNNPSDYYNWADIVVIPSIKPESFGLVAIEGMSAGCLIIAANHGGITDIIEDNKNGLLFKPSNSNDFQNKINFAISNKEAAEEIAEKGFLKFSNDFTVENYKKNIAKIFL